MRITIKFTDVYGGEEHSRTETLDTEPPPPGTDRDDLDEWASDVIFRHTGDGNAADSDAGYFAEILEIPGRPELTGIEFEWGL